MSNYAQKHVFLFLFQCSNKINALFYWSYTKKKLEKNIIWFLCKKDWKNHFEKYLYVSNKKMKTMFLWNMSKSRTLTSTFFPISKLFWAMSQLKTKISMKNSEIQKLEQVSAQMAPTPFLVACTRLYTVAQSLTLVDLKWSPPTSAVSLLWWRIEYISRENKICFGALFKIFKKIVIFYCIFYNKSLW